MDWKFATPLPGSALMPVEVTHNSTAVALTLRFVAQRDPPTDREKAPALAVLPEAEFRAELAKRLKDCPELVRWREAKRELIAERKRRTYFLSSKIEPLRAERQEVRAAAKRGWASQDVALADQLTPHEAELSRMDRELSTLEAAERAAEQDLDRLLVVAVDSAARAVCERCKTDHDAILAAIAGKIGKDLEGLLAGLRRLTAARSLLDRKVALRAPAEDVPAEC